MKRTLSTIALVGLLTAAGPAAAKPISYVGKTTGGHKISFKLRGSKIVNPTTMVPVNCLSIQGGGTPSVGADLMAPIGWVRLGQTAKFTTQQKPFAYYNEVDVNQQFSSHRGRNGVIRGRLRMQYSYLIPKFPIGTFQIYSCLGTATYKAKPKR